MKKGTNAHIHLPGGAASRYARVNYTRTHGGTETDITSAIIVCAYNMIMPARLINAARAAEEYSYVNNSQSPHARAGAHTRTPITRRERAAEGFMIIQRLISLWRNQPGVGGVSTLSAQAARQSAVKVAKTAAAAAIAREISGLKVAECILYSNEPTAPEGMTAFVAIITSSSPSSSSSSSSSSPK